MRCRDTRQVIAWQEVITLERRGSSRVASPPPAEPEATSTSPSLGKPLPQRNLPHHRRRRVNGDRSEKLIPLDPASSMKSNSSQTSFSDGQTRCSDSVGSVGDESAGSGKEGLTWGGGQGGDTGETVRATPTAGRQLDSMVDENRAEV